MRRLLICLLAMTLPILAQAKKKVVLKPEPLAVEPVSAPVVETPKMVWNYATPENYQFVEPGYRFPIQVKQALMKYVKGHTIYEAEFDKYFDDPKLFKPWIVDVVEKRISKEKELQRISTEAGDKMVELYYKALDEYKQTGSRSTYRIAQDIQGDISGYRADSIKHLEAQLEAERLLKVIKLWAAS